MHLIGHQLNSCGRSCWLSSFNPVLSWDLRSGKLSAYLAFKFIKFRLKKTCLLLWGPFELQMDPIAGRRSRCPLKRLTSQYSLVKPLVTTSVGNTKPRLVGGAMCPSWQMMEFVNGKDGIPYMKWNIFNSCLKPPTSRDSVEKTLAFSSECSLGVHRLQGKPEAPKPCA